MCKVFNVSADKMLFGEDFKNSDDITEICEKIKYLPENSLPLLQKIIDALLDYENSRVKQG